MSRTARHIRRKPPVDNAARRRMRHMNIEDIGDVIGTGIGVTQAYSAFRAAMDNYGADDIAELECHETPTLRELK